MNDISFEVIKVEKNVFEEGRAVRVWVDGHPVALVSWNKADAARRALNKTMDEEGGCGQ